MDDETACPRCRTTKYRNPNLKLLVNSCGHALCENCVELLFVRGSGVCPQCNVALRRHNFRTQVFEDASVEKEIEIRKKILKDYNLKEDSFPSLGEYNDYLEEVETIIFNLVNDIDVDETRRKVETYRKENKDLIAHNKFKKSADELYIESCLAVEAANKGTVNLANELAREVAMKQLKKEKEQQLLIDNLMFSDASATEIIQSHHDILRLKEQENAEKAAKAAAAAPSVTSQLGHQTTFIPLPTKQEVLYQYEELNINNLGPTAPSMDDVLHKGYLRQMRAEEPSETAGGYRIAVGCLKALESAVDGLFISGVHAISPASSSPASSSVGSNVDMEMSP